MAQKHHVTLSIVIPVYNEAGGLKTFHNQLLSVLDSLDTPFEVLYCDDGSSDGSDKIIQDLNQHDAHIKLIRLSRNFGKEAALAAGIAAASGAATILIDADGQHPVEKIPDFIEAWKNGAKVVVGLSKPYKREGWFKRYGSKIFYKLFNRLTSQKLIAGSSDFRLIDSQVKDAFLELHESNRITRGLIDWVGFERAYVPYVTQPRSVGTASYSRRKLIGLAANSFVSLTTTPMYLFGYLGVIISTVSLVLGSTIIIEQLILEDPLSWNFTGTAMLGMLIIFLVGIVLMSQGILSLYISHIHAESKGRPLYIIDKKRSIGLSQPEEK
jgi:dolichol-phosphate mannosyltransferase